MALIFSLGGLIVWYVGGRDVLAGQDDAGLADGVPGLPGDVLRAALHALAVHDLADELS